MEKWKKFDGKQLPLNAHNWAQETDIFRNDSVHWIKNYVWYEGETPETATDWIIVTDDGWYYKVMAEFMIWYTLPDGTMGAQAIWTKKHLNKSLENLKTFGKTLPDPDYQ